MSGSEGEGRNGNDVAAGLRQSVKEFGARSLGVGVGNGDGGGSV